MKDETSFVDLDGIREEMKGWQFPLHFIDFETCTVAIPFHVGRRPYEQIAFQFSHHKIDENGKIAHETQYINIKRGEFPNFEFVRELIKALSGDQGTIFRYSHHENTVLCQIHEQLKNSSEADKDELMSFIETITVKKAERAKDECHWRGQRSMVDLCDLVQRYYFHPMTRGSNSIKAVLPAILADSELLRNKYSKQIYGVEYGIPSLNFEKKAWLHFDSDGSVIDPYTQLPPVFNDYDRDTLDLLFKDEDIKNGGAAMMAYAYLQFSEMTDGERDRLKDALLRYCELDTLAMVMIWEFWNSIVQEEAAVSPA